MTLIKTTVSDRTKTDQNLFTVNLPRAATLYIANDSRVAPAAWITQNGWVKTTDQIVISESAKKFTLYRKSFSAGQAVFSGAGLNTNYFNYFVLVKM